MKAGHLSQYVSGVASKRLSEVEVNPATSNQHEFGGVNSLRKILGEVSGGKPVRFPASFVYLTDSSPEPVTADGDVSWYDSRWNQPHRRPELRLYYPSSAVTESAKAGDTLIVARRPDDSLLIVIADEASTVENQVRWLFGLEGNGQRYEIRTEEQADDRSVDLVARMLLEQLGIEVDDSDESYLEQLLETFGMSFPPTKVFSNFARQSVPDIHADGPPDDVILGWMEHEEMLFRTLERHIVAERLKAGFGKNGDDVDAFVEFSLSVHNRRKSRVGHALENHLEAIFQSQKILYSRTKETENKAKPDFLFPGAKEYHRKGFDAALLTMLGVKTTCKDRWRQVLSEAKKIKEKHLFTLEPGISVNQTDEMQANHLRLVVPSRLHESFAVKQREWLMPLGDFVSMIRQRQLKA